MTSPTLSIRPELPGDHRAVTDCFVESYNAEPWRESWTSETAERCLTELRGGSRAHSIVCVSNETVVGAAFLHARTYQDDSEIYIDEFFIRPGHQGQGVGTALLGAVRDYARSIGVSDLTLLTDNDKPAFDFYRSQGFRVGTSQVFMIG